MFASCKQWKEFVSVLDVSADRFAAHAQATFMVVGPLHCRMRLAGGHAAGWLIGSFVRA